MMVCDSYYGNRYSSRFGYNGNMGYGNMYRYARPHGGYYYRGQGMGYGYGNMYGGRGMGYGNMYGYDPNYGMNRYGGGRMYGRGGYGGYYGSRFYDDCYG